jgi:hypothetical protein
MSVSFHVLKKALRKSEKFQPTPYYKGLTTSSKKPKANDTT